MNNATERARLDIAYGAIVADGFFCLAFTMHLLQSGLSPTLADFLGVGVIICVFLSACWVIYDDYWMRNGAHRHDTVKKLRIRELHRGASIEYDGKRYRVENIDRASGEILIERVGRPGRIVVHIEGQQ